MKKLILLLFIPLVFACSSDSSDGDSNNSNENEDLILCKTFTIERPNECGEQITTTYDFSFIGDKLISGSELSINYFDCETIYFQQNFNNSYSGDLLTQTNYTRTISNDEDVNETWNILYEYNNQGLITSKTSPIQDRFYSWLNNNSVCQVSDSSGQLVATIIYDENFNIIESRSVQSDGSEHIIYREYDYSKKSPWAEANSGFFYQYTSADRANPRISYSNNYSDNVFYYEYTYNSDDYVVELLRSYNDDGVTRVYKYYYD